MIYKGMHGESQVLQGLVDQANQRIIDIRSGAKPALMPTQMRIIRPSSSLT